MPFSDQGNPGKVISLGVREAKEATKRGCCQLLTLSTEKEHLLEVDGLFVIRAFSIPTFNPFPLVAGSILLSGKTENHSVLFISVDGFCKH